MAVSFQDFCSGDISLIGIPYYFFKILKVGDSLSRLRNKFLALLLNIGSELRHLSLESDVLLFQMLFSTVEVGDEAVQPLHEGLFSRSN